MTETHEKDIGTNMKEPVFVSVAKFEQLEQQNNDSNGWIQ